MVRISQALKVSRSSLYYQPVKPSQDLKLALKIQDIHEDVDDTLGHRKLAPLLGVGKNKINRVMQLHQIQARRKKKKYVYPGQASQIFPNLARQIREAGEKQPLVIASDIFEFRLADQSKVYGCFALDEQGKQLLSLVFDYWMTSQLVQQTIINIPKSFTASNTVIKHLWHSDQGKQYSAEITKALLKTRGLTGSMSRAGTPTDNPFAERFVGLFKLAVVEKQKYYNLGELLKQAQKWVNFYNHIRPHQSLGQIPPVRYARQHGLPTVSTISLLTV